MKQTQLWLGLAAVLAGGPLLWAQPATSQPAHDETKWFRAARQLTRTEMGLSRSGEAYFSPDGQRICFQAYPAGKEDYQIYVMNRDGTDLKMVSTGDGATTCSFFHPSGEKLLFASNHEDLRPPAEFEPVRARGDGGAPSAQPATRPASAPSGGHPGGEPKTHHGGGPSYAWKYFPGMELYEYTFAKGALQRLTFSDGYDAEGSYSPDGRQIVFSSFRDGQQEIYICNSDGTAPRRITQTSGGNGGPFFSPDGQRIVYRADRTGSGNLQIYVNNVAGTDEKLLTGASAFHWCPFWHPSGKWLIFTYCNFRAGANFDLYVLRDDGSETHRVTSEAAFDGLPVFSPDGRYLMWTSNRYGLDSPQVYLAEFLGLTPAGELRVKD